jgi:hypothetical protein
LEREILVCEGTDSKIHVKLHRNESWKCCCGYPMSLFGMDPEK